ncbi:MAG: DUF5020 family protein [Porphyromonas sp.]|nr:DUF5020 family protein [Porphyromonas sp.]
MKRLYLFLVFALTLGASLAQAQNVQLHYDFGRRLYPGKQAERPNLTTTVEMFRPDSWGSTFFFVDMNYRSEGVTMAYWEVARDIKLWKAPVALHLEYNGGLSNSFSFGNAYLAGLNYIYNNRDFSGGFTLAAMYKHLARQARPHSYQLTGVWYRHFAGGLLSFSGFADLWGDRHYVTGRNMTVFLAEPQLWLNLNKLPGVNPKFNLSIGTEVEVSTNFSVLDETIINPTLGLKWTF